MIVFRVRTVPAFRLMLAGMVLVLASGAEARQQQPGHSHSHPEPRRPGTRSAEEDRQRLGPPVTVELGGYGSAPGRLLEPSAVAFSADGRVFVADRGNHRIQVFGPDGKILHGWGRPGARTGEFWDPSGIAVNADGEVFVADRGNDRIQVFDARGGFLRQWGGGTLSAPCALAVDDRMVAVVEADRCRVQIFSPRGDAIRILGDRGDAAGRFLAPQGVALDDRGNLYVADTGNCRIQKFDPKGAFVRQWGTWGPREGMMANPAAVACAEGRVYVADTGNHRVQIFDGAGAFLNQWGELPVVAHDGNGRLHFPAGIAVSGGGRVAVCEPMEYRIQVFPPNGARPPKPPALGPPPVPPPAPKVRTHALAAVLEADTHSVLFLDAAPKPPTFVARVGDFGKRLGELNGPAGIAFDSTAGRAYVSERGNRRIQLFELIPDPASPAGYSPFARSVGAWDLATLFPPPTPELTVERSRPGALALDARGNLYLADDGNGAVLVFSREMKFVRSILLPASHRPGLLSGLAATADGKTVYALEKFSCSVLAFDGEGRLKSAWGRRGAAGPDELLSPSGIAVDAAGTVLVSDSLLNEVRKYDPAGKLMARWGELGKDVEFHCPGAVSILRPDLFVVDDAGAHCARIVSPDGMDLLFKGVLPPISAPGK